MSRILLQPGTLWNAVIERSETALAAGALRPIGTRQRFIEQAGMRFVVRVAENLRRKAEEKRRQTERTNESAADVNPFLPPEPELTVGPVSDTHLALLNKFNVVEHHLLIVTRVFEHQERLLSHDDFTALWACMGEYEGLGFYNGGTVAGASQRHKHLQLIPLPLTAGGPQVPLDALIEASPPAAGITTLPTLPFRHRLLRLEPGTVADPYAAAQLTHTAYLQMLEALGIGTVTIEGELRQGAPYNLLATRRWLLLVPRSREHYRSISVNAMGFAGSLFVRDEAELALVEETGPMSLLQEVA